MIPPCSREVNPPRALYMFLTVTVDLTALLASSRDWDTLEWAWKEWREVSGKLMKDDYEEFVGLLNEAAKINRKSCDSSSRHKFIQYLSQSSNIFSVVNPGTDSVPESIGGYSSIRSRAESLQICHNNIPQESKTPVQCVLQS